MSATLYGIPASHPVLATELMLERKGIAYRRIDLPQWFHRPMLRALRFSGVTVPALKLDDGRRVQRTGVIARVLDQIEPEPRLVPDDPRVLQIEAWCDGEFQQVGRRVSYWSLSRHPQAVDSYLAGSHLILPRPAVKPLAPAVIKLLVRHHQARDEAVRADLANLPGMLDLIDGWIAEGAIGGADPNVGDYQVATCLALLMTFDDLRPLIAGHPAGRLALRVAPGYPGHMPATFPKEWIESDAT